MTPNNPKTEASTRKTPGTWCLPARSTQPERYSRSPGQHDFSVQIRRLKRPLMKKVWLQKLWDSMIPSIWTCGRLNSGQRARSYDPRNLCCAVSPKLEQIIFQDRFGDLIFVFKESSEYQSWRKFRAIQPGHQMCIIWSPDVGDMVPARKGCESGKSGGDWFYGNQVPFSPKEDLVQGKVENAPRLPKGVNTTPWAPKEGWSIHPIIREPATRGEAPGGSRRPPQVLELPRRWPRSYPSHHGWPYVVKPWWSSGAHALIPSRQLYILHSMVI
jgi:hypothetical protein